MESQYQGVADQARAAATSAQEALSAREAQVTALRDELQQARDRAEELGRAEANWRSRHDSLTQTVSNIGT